MEPDNGFDPQPEPKNLRDRLKEHSGKRRKTIPCPLVGGITIQNLTAQEQIDLAARIPEGLSDLEMMAYYLAACVLDEHDRPMYSDADHQEIMELDPRILGALGKEVREICGLNTSVRDAAKN